jgi:hypothetical protein
VSQKTKWQIYSKFQHSNKFQQAESLALSYRGELRPKSLHGKRFYKAGHRDIAEKSPYHFKKASIPQKCIQKASEFLKKPQFL